jgi:hypothetical protein
MYGQSTKSKATQDVEVAEGLYLLLSVMRDPCPACHTIVSDKAEGLR